MVGGAVVGGAVVDGAARRDVCLVVVGGGDLGLGIRLLVGGAMVGGAIVGGAMVGGAMVGGAMVGGASGAMWASWSLATDVTRPNRDRPQRGQATRKNPTIN